MSVSTTLPSATSPVYCTDEDIAVVAGGDFVSLCPPSQLMASGTDGVFAAAAQWVLTSASVDFKAYGVVPNQVVLLTQPKASFPGGGRMFAIDAVDTGSITLRLPHKDLDVGMPPAPAAGLSGVQFAIHTLDPQIEEATFDLKRRYAIDDSVGGDFTRASTWMYDQRDLRMAVVYTVLRDRYIFESRASTGDFAEKLKRVKQQLDDVIARVQVRFGPFGNSSEPSTIFSCKLSR